MFRFTDARSSSLFLPISHPFFFPSIYRAIHLSVFDPRPTSYQRKISEIYQAIAFLYTAVCHFVLLLFPAFHLRRNIISTNRISTRRGRIWVGEEASDIHQILRRLFFKRKNTKIHLDCRVLQSYLYTLLSFQFCCLSRFPKFTWFLFKIYYYLDELSLQRWSHAHREKAVSFKCLWRMDLRQQLVPGKRVATSNAVSPNPLL